jgi:hypothetical protein
MREPADQPDRRFPQLKQNLGGYFLGVYVVTLDSYLNGPLAYM